MKRNLATDFSILRSNFLFKLTLFVRVSSVSVTISMEAHQNRLLRKTRKARRKVRIAGESLFLIDFTNSFY